MLFLQQLINGLTIGSVYALVALGFSLIYGVLGLIHFAHGDVYMFGAFIAFTLMVILKASFWSVVIFTMLATALLGIIIDQSAYRPLRKVPVAAQLVVSLAVGISLRNIVMLVWGSRTRPFPFIFGSGVIWIGDFPISILQVIIPLTAIVITIFVQMILRYSRIGRAIRATSLDLEMSSLCAVNPERIAMIVFAVGSLLGGVAAILVGMYYGTISFDMGMSMTVKGFVAALLGGLGSLSGALLGGIILGLAEGLAQAYISTAYKDAVSLIILIGVLLLRPEGLLNVSTERAG
jgi:branched-chain amino acid transport system permease protein